MAIDLPGDIEWYRLKYDADRRDHWETYLSADERQQMNRYGTQKRRDEFLLGRAALRELLAQRLREEPGEIAVHQADDGAPEVDGSTLQVSLTHSHGWAAAVVASRPVGIDMEYIQPRHERLYEQILHDGEMEMFHALPCDHAERQILCWTLKEATLKAVRPAEQLSMKKLRIDCSYETRRADVHVLHPLSDWAVTFERIDNFYISIAYPASGAADR